MHETETADAIPPAGVAAAVAAAVVVPRGDPTSPASSVSSVRR